MTRHFDSCATRAAVWSARYCWHRRLPGPSCPDLAKLQSANARVPSVATSRRTSPSAHFRTCRCSGTYTSFQIARPRTAKAPRPSIVEAFGKIWLFSIALRHWHASTGEQVAVVGPLAHAVDNSYTARYLEAIIPPGERTPVHTHAGPEAWYVVAGAQCLETPEGITVARAGESAVVREGLPMILSSDGTETRNSFALVLHDSAKPWTMVMQGDEWKPAGRCPK